MQRKVPLVRVDCPKDRPEPSPAILARDPWLRRRFKSDRTSAAERVLELDDSLYFYVGRACPLFGDVVFVYDPDMSANWPGTATPFDTGGIIGYIHANGLPGSALESEKRDDPSKLLDAERKPLRAYVHDHLRQLSEWQEHFASFLNQYFAKSIDYMQGERPRHDDSTMRHHANGKEWRAWTWEIQARCDHELFDGLWLMCMSRVARDLLVAEVMKLPRHEQERWFALLDDKNRARIVNAVEAAQVCDEAEREIVRPWI